MSYVSKKWSAGDTITSAALNNIEKGVSLAQGRVTNIEEFFAANRVEGTTDDSLALSQAIAASSGGCLRLNRARLRIQQKVSVSVNDVFISAEGAVVDLIDNGTTSGVTIDFHDCQRVTINGGTYRQTATQRTGVYGNLTMRNVTDWVISNVVIIGGSSTGVFVLGGSRFRIVDVRVSDTQADGIHISRGSTDFFIVNPHITNTGDDGIGIIAVTTEPTDSSKTYAPIARGVIIDPIVTNLTKVGGGVSLVGVRDCVLRGGIIQNVPTSGIKITTDSPAGAPQEPTNVLVQGVITRNSVKGLSVGPSFDVYLDSIQSLSNTDVGIEVNGATRLLIDGGKYRGNVFGIYEAAGTGNYAINVDVRGNSNAPIQKQSLVSERCVGLDL